MPRTFKNSPETQFTFRLARDLGMTVAQLQATMSSYEYSQWVAFYLFEQEERNKQIALRQAEANKRRT